MLNSNCYLDLKKKKKYLDYDEFIYTQTTLNK